MEDLSFANDPAIKGRYEVSGILGTGGFARVYRARQLATGQEVAIKILHVPLIEGTVGAERRERFRREVRFSAELHHPNIVPLIDLGDTSDGQLFAVFAFVPGQNLGTILAAEKCLEPEEALHLMTQVLDALSSAHAHGIVHRDLKPENVMISISGARRNALVFDFGVGTVIDEEGRLAIERITQSGEYLGTPVYSAPEQLRCDPPTVLSDVYSWGLIFLECLTGEPAIGTRRPYEAAYRQLGPSAVHMPRALQGHPLGELLTVATQKDVTRRVLSAGELLEALKRISRGELPARDDLVGSRPSEAPLDPRPASTGSSAPLSGQWLIRAGRNQNFTGRKAILEKLESALASTRPLAVVALHGLGGIGKTQIALEYAYRNADRYKLVAWIRAEEPETLAADYSSISTAVKLGETPDQRRKVEAVRAWLERRSSWLLIFDNVSNPEAIRDYLPRSHAGHVIVTSRHHAWRDVAVGINIDVLDSEDAVEFILRRTGESDRELATELADELGRLPLALEEATAYVDATGRSVASYLVLLRTQRRQVLFANMPGCDRRVRDAWELSFAAVEQGMKAAANLLKLCAFLAPEEIPFALLEKGAEGLAEGLREGFTSALSRDECVAALRRYSLVKVEDDALSLHRLVQLVTRERLPPDERTFWGNAALTLVDTAYPAKAIAGEYYPDSGKFLPHALAALGNTELSDHPELASRILRRTGGYMSAKGSHDRARDHLERALRLLEGATPTDELQVGGTLWELGMVHYALGEAQLARERLERAVAVLAGSSSRGAELFRTQAFVALSWVLRAVGDFDGASAAADNARGLLLPDRPNDPLSATIFALSARAAFSRNLIPEAREHLGRARALMDRARDPWHPINCGTWFLVSQVEFDLGRLDAAFLSAERGARVGELAYGRNHPLVCLNMCVRGFVALRRGDIVTARLSFSRALDGGRRACRRLHEDIAVAQVGLAEALAEASDVELAITELRSALDNLPRLCGNPARVEGQARFALAELLGRRGEREAAKNEGALGLAAIRAAFGESHALCIQGLNALGRVHLERGDVTSAVPYFEDAVKLATKLGLENHFAYAESLEGLGIAVAGSDAARGAELLAHALRVFEAELGREHPATRRAANRVAG